MKKTEQQPMNININLKDAVDIVCEECGNKYFTDAMQIKKLSALLSPNGQDSLIPIQVFICTKCGHVNSEFLPQI
ncbi:MAG: hypothetical protein M0R17_09060 [Candidatus Omnitrophica bacterium]|jgi:hypothetical protein|nr:hypothetical protein [Candidatus Omnitrophota bacterium]